MPKIVVLRPMQKQLASFNEPDWELVFATGEDEIEAELPGAEVVLGWHKSIPELVQTDVSPLRWVQAYSAGVDGIPLDILAQNKVWLTTASGVHTNSISEMVFGMLLSLTRGIHTAALAQPQHKWAKAQVAACQPEIHGATLGILGAGHIGREVARIAAAFNMKVLGLRHSGEPEQGFEEMYTTGGRCEMLERCDYVVNILPLTKDTERLIGAAEFASMKRGAVYISVGRGGTTDQPALIDALQSGQLAAAGLDVTEPEPLPPESPLWDMPNVLITPHVAGGTPHYNERAAQIFLRNFAQYVQGNPPEENLVSYKLGY